LLDCITSSGRDDVGGPLPDHRLASGGDVREKLVSLWYHDHRMDFTAANLYAGLDGFYLLFDETDSGQSVGDVVTIKSPEVANSTCPCCCTTSSSDSTNRVRGGSLK